MQTEIKNPLAMATTSDRMGNTGKLLGKRVTFTGTASASELKKQFKAEGLKGKKLEAAVQKVLRGEANIRQVVGVAVVQAYIAKGFVPDVMNVNKADTKATLTFVKVEKQDVEPATMSDEELVANLARLQAEADARKATITLKE